MSSLTEHWMPLYLSCIAGASTCLGAAVVFFHPKNGDNLRVVSPNTMSFSLALAGSVMVTVSVISIGPECLRMPNADENAGYQLMDLASSQFLQRIISFSLGSALYFGLSQFAFPEPEEVIELGLETAADKMVEVMDEEEATEKETNTSNSATKSNKRESSKHKAAIVRSRKKLENFPAKFDGDEHQPFIQSTSSSDEDDNCKPLVLSPQFSWANWSRGADLDKEQRRAWRVAMLLFVSLLLHNFPEGLAVAASALESKKLGITVMIGIMIHNIPEGIAIAVPCLAARPDSPFLGFALASLSGLAEPAGAFVALLLLRKVSQEDDESTFFNMENVLAFVAGIMIMVALYELFPEARRNTSLGYNHFIAGTVSGIVIMVATELYI